MKSAKTAPGLIFVLKKEKSKKMQSADKILDILEENRGKRISGAELAAQLGISRNAVWKAVNYLRDEGHMISAVKNCGYCLENSSSTLSVPAIEKRLNTDMYSIKTYKTVTSTNTMLKQMAQEGAPEGTVIIAEEQTSGRGRMNREYFSPKGTGIYISMLVRPHLPAQKALLLTTCTAVAAAKAIEAVTGKAAGIKWVNDVFMDGKKVCGILTDASVNVENGELNYAVIGVGINLLEPEKGFPDSIKSIAGAILDGSENLGSQKAEIIAGLLNNFAECYKNLSDKAYYHEYVKRSVLIGETVTFNYRGESCEGEVTGINEDYSLAVSISENETLSLSSGEVSVRLK